MPATEPEDDQKKKHSRVTCRNAECGKTYSNRSNRDRRENKSDYSPAPRRIGLQIPIFSKELKKYSCPLTNCPVTSTFKSNITRYIKAGCQTLSKKKVDNKVYLYCKETFAQKSNWDRHIKRIHSNAEPNLSQVDTTDTELPVPSFDSDMAEKMNVSFLSEDGSVFEQRMRMVDEEIPIFEVFEPH